MADTERALTTIELAPLVSTEMAHNRLAEIRDFVKQELREGLDGDFAVIPGTGKKPSLLQPGAEKLIEKLGLAPTFPEERWAYENHERGEYMVDMLCRLISPATERVYAECWGSAGRSAQEEVEESNAKAREYAAKDGKPAPVDKPLRFSHKGLARNTAMKMAQKSALVGATLKAARLAVDFTQDVEDFTRPPATASASVKPGDPHWCIQHGAEWFMRGKMQSFAHPIDGQKEWCYEPKLATGPRTDPHHASPQTRPAVATTPARDSPAPPPESAPGASHEGTGKQAETAADYDTDLTEVQALKAKAGLTDAQLANRIRNKFENRGFKQLTDQERLEVKRMLEVVIAEHEAAADLGLTD